MSLITWSIYRLSDGTFTGQRYSASDDRCLSQNTPEGCAAIAGEFDPKAQRVEVETGRILKYSPPAEEESAWQAEIRIMAELSALDSAYIRALEDRESEDPLAQRRLDSVRDKKVTLRAELKRLRG